MTVPDDARVALLRGINVGGKNLVSMSELRDVLTVAGYADVRTYIQSGNVALRSAVAVAQLEDDLEALLARRVGVPVMVVALDGDQVRRVVEEAPPGFGDDPDATKYDVAFLKAPLTAPEAVRAFDPRDGVDRIWAPRFDDPQVVYFSRDAAQLSRSRMSRVTGKTAYQRMTIRNWRTTTKLLDMVREG